MESMIYGFNLIIKIVIATVLAVLFGNGSVVAFNHFPEKWFEDWDPGQKNQRVLPEKLLEADHAGRQRLPSTPWKYLFTGIFGISGVWLSITAGAQYEIGTMMVLFIVLEMAVCDWLYRTVPDQLQILLAVSALGFIQFNDKWWEPLAGAGLGMAIALSVWGLGVLIFRTGSLGGADIKFFICMGFVVGRTGIAVIFVLTTMCFAAYSAMKIAMRKGTLQDTNPMLPPAFAGVMIYMLLLYNMTDVIQL